MVPEGFAKACPNPLYMRISFVIPSLSNAALNVFISGNGLAWSWSPNIPKTAHFIFESSCLSAI